jgi:prepilin-type N-terminal cleavage/methylation domain-containing protein
LNRWFSQFWSNERGLTLIEVLGAMTIFTMVIAVAYSALLFGMETFKKGETRSHLQDDLRLASQALIKEVRYATELEILNLTGCPTPIPQDGYHYICLNNVNKIVYKKASESSAGYLIDGSLGINAEYNIIFRNHTDNKILEFDLESKSKRQKYKIEKSKVKLLNAPAVIHPGGTSTYKVIKYK